MSMTTVCRCGWKLIAPHLWKISYSLLICVCPPIATAITVTKLVFLPIVAFFNFISPLFSRLHPLQRLLQETTRKRVPPVRSYNNEAPECLLCCICLESLRTVLLQPCNHFCVCSLCMDRLMSTSEPRCPVCRTSVEDHTSIFLS
uniref:RING-type domain-containing protein n=1 Tax=Syphacia muris TaxID=451379 RepID=A0A0N5AL85_9BILA